MALVTFGTPLPQRHIIGDLVLKFFVVNGASGSTLPTGMSQLLWWDVQQFPQGGGASVITNITQAQNILTISSSGTMVNEVVMVVGREG
jgi:hypothetical protein